MMYAENTINVRTDDGTPNTIHWLSPQIARGSIHTVLVCSFVFVQRGIAAGFSKGCGI
jgi:hypothetical protein